MRNIFNFLQNRYIGIAACFVAFSFLAQPVYATSKLKSCDYRVFNIKTNQQVSGLELLNQIANTCDFSLIVKDDFASTILNKELQGINIKNLSLDDVFDVIISDNDLYYDYKKNFLRIYGLKTKTFKVDYITSIRKGTSVLDASLEGSSENSDSTSNTSSVNNVSSEDSFDFWSTMEKEITSMLNTGSESYTAQAPIINQNAGLITVTGTKKQLDRIEEYLDVLKERLHKQVLIDVSIYSVVLDKSKTTGIDWSKFNLYINSTAKFNNKSKYASTGSSHYLGTDSDGKPILNSGLAGAFSDTNHLAIVNDALFTMSGLIDFLNTNGKTKVISNPKVLTLNNQPALITVGDTINYKLLKSTSASDSGSTVSQDEEVKSIFIGVLLNITPEITDKNEIILRINPSVSDFKNSEDEKITSVRTIAPDTVEKKLSTVVKVHNGNTIILGGLIKTKEGVEKSKVPLLGDLPLLGNAFKHSADTTQTSELIFVITPRIIGAKDDTKTTLKDLGFSKSIYEQ
jgi:general secretion pathway protein D